MSAPIALLDPNILYDVVLRDVLMQIMPLVAVSGHVVGMGMI